MGYVLCALTLLLKGQRRRLFFVFSFAKVGRRFSNGQVIESIERLWEGDRSSDAKKNVCANYFGVNTLMTAFKSTNESGSCNIIGTQGGL